jgi:ankyrin repeat protein
LICDLRNVLLTFDRSKTGSLNQVEEVFRLEGVDVNCTDVDGWTPLSYAVKRGEIDLVILLVRPNLV